MTQRQWSIRLGNEAEMDFAHILQYTRDTFGPQQAAVYQTTLIDALAALEAGPDVPGNIRRDEILLNLRTLHVARRGRNGRHFIMYRAVAGDVIEVIRILYDGMDLARHIPPNLE